MTTSNNQSGAPDPAPDAILADFHGLDGAAASTLDLIIPDAYDDLPELFDPASDDADFADVADVNNAGDTDGRTIEEIIPEIYDDLAEDEYAGERINGDTLVTVTSDGAPPFTQTAAAFAKANDNDEEVLAALRALNTEAAASIGGGAAPLFTIAIAPTATA